MNLYVIILVIIIGVIGWSHGHYVFYVKRNNIWEIHNDLQRKIQKSSSKTKISPPLIKGINFNIIFKVFLII
jgi:ubiquitin C-terminal hydrolase